MLVFYSDFFSFYSVKSRASKTLVLLLSVAVFAIASFSQQSPVRSQEVSEEDGQPVLLKHLPDYEAVKAQAQFVTDKDALRRAAGGDAVLELLDFSPGTEAVIAPYPQGRLVIVEYTNPQSSTEVDARIQQHIAATPQSPFAYRRIGNYNAFVFGVTDPVAAGALLDQVKYEKTVQWLGEDPYLLKRLERYMISTSRDIMLSTVLAIVLGLASAVVMGIVAGFIFFRVRDQKRSSRAAFSDAGGLTRLNLDGLSE
jgi:hypothetical protein